MPKTVKNKNTLNLEDMNNQDLKNNIDLRDFSNFNDCFINFNTYTVELEKLEKNNGAEK